MKEQMENALNWVKGNKAQIIGGAVVVTVVAVGAFAFINARNNETLESIADAIETGTKAMAS